MKRMLMILGLLLAVPGLLNANVSAAQQQTDQSKMVHKDCHEGHHHFMNGEKWQEKMKEREQEIRSWVNQYTPEKKQEWEKVLTEGKTLREKWHSPEFAQKREQWKKNKIAQMQALKKAYEDGKITKDEYIAKAHQGMKMGAWKTYDELKMAVETKKDQQAKALLNQLLTQYKMHNEKMKSMMQYSSNQ
ncbi:hypothetical protein ACQYAD_12975 [Neobacillus sp. SM06]|uniref:hypothetical protein n=1 Tax=Neobacillus sp. SM06 TaxID=3422492 RepID=UPI003D280E23